MNKAFILILLGIILFSFPGHRSATAEWYPTDYSYYSDCNCNSGYNYPGTYYPNPTYNNYSYPSYGGYYANPVTIYSNYPTYSNYSYPTGSFYPGATNYYSPGYSNYSSSGFNNYYPNSSSANFFGAFPRPNTAPNTRGYVLFESYGAGQQVIWQ